MKKLLAAASVVIFLLILVSFGSSNTGLFHLSPKSESGVLDREWRLLGEVEVKPGRNTGLLSEYVP